MTKNEQIAELVSTYYKLAIQKAEGDTFDDIYDGCVNWPDTLKWAVKTVESGQFETEMEALKNDP